MRREVRLVDGFTLDDFARAFAGFVQLFGVRPLRALASIDAFFALAALAAPQGIPTALELRYEGVRIEAAVLAPGTLILEGEVDETRMGDW